MIYLMKLKNGNEYEIGQKDRDSITEILLSARSERPDFIEMKNYDLVLSTTSIASIERHRHEISNPPTREEELKAFNERWAKDHPE